MINKIYLRHKQKIVLPEGEGTGELNIREVATLLHNLESYGFTFSEALLRRLVNYTTKDIGEFYDKLIYNLRKSIGANKKYKPMYPNFPTQVMEASGAELYINAICHYMGDWLGLRILPNYEKTERPALTERTKLKVIDIGTVKDFEKIFTDLVASKVAGSETDREEIEWFIAKYDSPITQLLPDEIPLKENKILVIKLLLKYRDASTEVAKKYFKTATDVLRFAVALSDGDVSLARKPKFKNFSRPERRMLKGLAESCKSLVEDMLRYKEEWKRLNEKIHIFENKQYKELANAMRVLVNKGLVYTTFNNKVEEALKNNDTDTVVELLSSRPGDFARRLDHVLRTANSTQVVVDAFKEVAERVATPTLLQIIAHFKGRNEERDIRAFFPKGDVAKVQAIMNELPEINEGLCKEVVKICKDALIKLYSEKEDLGKVYLDEGLKQFTVPSALRSASKSLRTVGRGSRLDLPEKNIIRLFIWWKDGKGENDWDDRVDLDLSVLALDENCKYIDQVSYTDLRTDGMTHGGDITSAPKGASEFIDIDIGKLLARDVRYALMSVYSYTEQAYCDLPECFAGFMVRKEQSGGEIYEPKTVEEKFDLTANSKVAIPFIFDLIERKAIWTDLSLKSNPSHNNNILENMSSLQLMAKAMVTLNKPSLYDLLSLHVRARGELVPDTEDAETIFSIEEGTHLQIEDLLANYV